MSKIIALTGEICSGKSTALYCFSKMGARFLSQDHLNYMLAVKPDIVSILKDQIDTYRSFNPKTPLVIEVHLDIVNKFPEWFDEIVWIESSIEKRIKRFASRYPEIDMNSEYGWSLLFSEKLFSPTHVITNDGTQEELSEKISSLWLSNFASKP